MSYPILYRANATDFDNLGLGVLKDTIRCMVIEEINGVFELEMTYPIDGIHGNNIEIDQIIKADAGHAAFSRNQLFRIERVDKSVNGIIEIFARHVSVLAQSLVLEPEVVINTQTAVNALDIWRRSITTSNPFTVSSNVSGFNSTTFNITTQQNARMALGGTPGSILSVWGGEYVFDNYRIDLRANRGGRANTLISYGRNLVDLNQEESIANTFTSIYPYAIFREGEQERIITIPEFVIDSTHANAFSHRRVLPVDFSREFARDVVPTVARLRALALEYLQTNEIGIPRVALKLRFVDLTKTLNQSGLTYERLNLCDEVPVRFEKLGIDTVAKVVRIQWDVLLDQYDFLEIGENRVSLGDRLREIERDVNVANNNSDTALTAANGKNTVFFGPTQPTPPFRVGDLWYRPNGEHTELWAWDGNGWEFIMSTAPNEVLLAQLEENRRIIAESNERVAESQRRIDEISGNFEEQRRQILGMEDVLGTLDNNLAQNREAVAEANRRVEEATSNIDQMSRDITQATTGSIHGSRIVDETIIGEKIAQRTLTSNQLFVGDLTNLATINEIIGAQTVIGENVLGGTRFTPNTTGGSIGGNFAQMQKRTAAQEFLPFSNRRPNDFKAGDEVFFSFDIWCATNRTIRFLGATYTVDDNVATNRVIHESVNFTTGTSTWRTISGVLRLSQDAWDTAPFYSFAIRETSASGRVQMAVRNVVVRRRSDGNLIVDGAISSNHVEASTIRGNHIQAGTITGENIAARTITANQLMVADMTNFATINERIGAQTNVPSTTLGGTRFTLNTEGGSIGGNGREMQKLVANQQHLPFCARTTNGFRHNDEVFYSFEIWCSVTRTMNFTATRFTVDSGNGAGFNNASFSTRAEEWVTISGSLRLNTTLWDTSLFYVFGVNDATASGRVQIAVRNVVVRRRNGGELIVDGTIRGNHIEANTIRGNHIQAGTITGENIEARTLTANQLMVADMSNHATIDERLGARTNVPVGTWGGTRFTLNTAGGSIGGNAREMQKLVDNQQYLPFCQRTPNAFRNNDEVFYSFDIWCAVARNMNFSAARFTVDSGVGTVQNAAFMTTAGAWVTISGNMRLNNTLWDTALFYVFGINDTVGADRPQIAVRNVVVRRRNRGELIVDGAIRGNHIEANAITAREIAAGTITATEIGVESITGDRLQFGTITGDKLAVRTITANQLNIADMTNHATINERVGARTNVPTTTMGGTRHTTNTAGGSIGGNSPEIQKMNATNQFLPFCQRTPNAFRNNEEVFFSFEVWCTVARNIRFFAARFTSDSDVASARVLQETPNQQTTAGGWRTITGTLRLNAAAWDTALFYNFGINDVTASGRVQIAVRNVIVRRKNGGELIVDGTIRGNHIEANSISAREISAGAITATEIATGAITSDKIRAGAITGDMITTGTLDATLIKTGTLDASNIRVVHLNATSITAGVLNVDRIEANSITGDKIRAGAITADMITTGTMSGDRIRGGTVNVVNVMAQGIGAALIDAGEIWASRIIMRGQMDAISLNAHTTIAETVTAGTVRAGDLNATNINGGTINNSRILLTSGTQRIDINQGQLSFSQQVSNVWRTRSNFSNLGITLNADITNINGGQTTNARVAQFHLGSTPGFNGGGVMLDINNAASAFRLRFTPQGSSSLRTALTLSGRGGTIELGVPLQVDTLRPVQGSGGLRIAHSGSNVVFRDERFFTGLYFNQRNGGMAIIVNGTVRQSWD